MKRITGWIASTRLALLLLALIALSAVIGTFIPQQHAAGPFLHRYPALGSLLRGVGFFDVFHSLWFMALEAMLALNLAACTWFRFPSLWTRFRRGSLDERAIQAENTVVAAGNLGEAASQAEKHLNGRYGKPVRTPTRSGSGLLLSWRKYSFSSLSVLFIHLGVLIVLAGALAGSIFGFEGRTRIPEGDAIRTVGLKGGAEKDLGFEVRCARFSAAFYPTGAPREFKSDLEFIRGGRVVHRAVLRVNEPASFEGIRFYQESYGSIPEEVTLGMTGPEGAGRTIRVGLRESYPIPGSDAVLRLVRAEEDLMGFGPGVKLSIHSRGRDTEFWVFKNIEALKAENPGLLESIPVFDPERFKPYRFALKSMQVRSYTGLLVSRDPAFPFVFAGFAVMAAGCCILYFFGPRRISLALEPAPEGVRVGIACRFDRNRAAEAREAERIMDLLGRRGDRR